ncbi:glycoside hydrolase family 26 protein [Draconibacterium mangrovi]|uniref:glycoside hydrolase family 26 protein n=1 Tax=Draconibacterium mangrovi TaxID=2697469 RepID=UPI0021D29EE5|nr:glycoside hydrolase family 26 protein [Draconibacterium mangrovi]
MITKKERILLYILICLLYGCQTVLKRDTTREKLIDDLNEIQGKGILFGHQDDLAYGVGWEYIDGESDVKRLTGDYPALFGWELGGIELGRNVNLDSVPFSKIHDFVVWVNERGGINTFSWHPYSPIDSVDSWHGDMVVVKHILPGGDFHQQFNNQLDIIAAFFLDLKDKSGSSIPFIFRPWHEMDEAWFWWGSNSCTPVEFQKLFRYTISYLRNKGLNNMVVAYSPDCNFDSQEKYLQWYPGDAYVDILGMDNYHDLKQSGGEKNAIDKLHIVIEVAKEKGKLAALTETGLELVNDSTWYSKKLGAVLSDSVVKENLSYVMLWRNDSEKHFYFPFPGHQAAADAKELLSQPNILLLNEFNQIKK